MGKLVCLAEHLRAFAPAAAAVAAAVAALVGTAVVAGAWASAPVTDGKAPPAAALPTLASAAVVARAGHASAGYDGVVEAIQQSVVAAQVPGAVVALQVRAGDKVLAGQVLMRIDARAAEQNALAGSAQANAARAAMEEATHDVERQQQLFAEGFISRAALDRAQARLKTAQAGVSAQLATASAAHTQSDLHIVRAPYAGVVGAVSVVIGDMAMPGRPLLTLYDPAALRVTAAIPSSTAAAVDASGVVQIEVPGATRSRIRPVRMQWLPMVDAGSHTRELRLELPADVHAAPGMFARAWLQGDGGAEGAEMAGGSRLFVPAQALVRRAELAAVYVVGDDGRPALRQVRPGYGEGAEIEILSGVSSGERVALDPQAAARVR